MKREYILAYMDMAERFGQTSKAVRLKVGCLIVKPEGGVIAEGVNGMPPGWPTEVCERKEYYFAPSSGTLNEYQYDLQDDRGKYKLVTRKECRHAEIAALEKLWFSPVSAEGCYMFLSHSPCPECCIKIKTAKISKLFYRHHYRITEGLDYLEKAGIIVEQIKPEGE